MTYLVRDLNIHATDVKVRVYPSRLTERGIFKHLTAPLALALLAVGIVVHRIDVVHLNIAPRGSTWRKMAFAALARLLGRKVVLHLHGSGYHEFFGQQNSRRQALIRGFFQSADKVVVLSPFWRRFALDGLQLDPGKVVEIPNGVPAAVESPPEPRSVLAPQIAFLGLVGARKGVDVLLDALALMAGDAQWRMVIGGNGDVETAQAQAAALGLADRVTFLGWIGESQVDEILRASDIFVLPSRAENQPVSILEAMARSVPVISTTVGAIPDQVIDGETGLLVPPGDAPALAAALTRLIANPQLRARMGAAGLERFQAQFSVAACGERFAKLYRELA